MTQLSHSADHMEAANYMEHSKPGVTIAAQNLCVKGYLQKVDRDLVFTDLGQSIVKNG